MDSDPMRFLIDGYNLLHALGMAPRAGTSSLERARLRMLEWLSSRLGERKPDICLVFDSRNQRGGGQQEFRGLRICFSKRESADDLIEELIRDEADPAGLTVISNDRRLQHAASRRSCASWNCGQFIDWLLQGDNQHPPAPRPEIHDKPEGPSGDEMEEWLKRFGG
jgi:predicted RNA-binding protein with PIN domain